MFLDIHELEKHAIAFDESLLPGRLDFGEGVCQVEQFQTRGTAELVASDIRLRGFLRTAVEVLCARCLEPARRGIELQFDLFYRPIQSIARDAEIEIKAEDLDVGFYRGDGLLLEDAIKEQVLLALPIKLTCRPDCAGLCPQCGQNRNLVHCNCQSAWMDDRWGSLAKFKR